MFGKHNIWVSQEVIDYQIDDPVGKKLEEAIMSIDLSISEGKYKTNKMLLDKAPEARLIEKILKDRFGLNLLFNSTLSEVYDAAILPFEGDTVLSMSSLSGLSDSVNKITNQELHDSAVKAIKERESVRKSMHDKTGWVNNKLAKVGGYLSEVRHELLINFFRLFRSNQTPSNIAAIILHETGHAFDGLAQHHRLTTTNSTILSIVQDLNNNSPDVVYHRYKAYFRKNDITETMLGNDKESINFRSTLARTYLKSLEGEYINSKYDQTNFESSADSFAVRLGYGASLANALMVIREHERTINYVDNRGLYQSKSIIDIFHSIGVMSVIGGTFLATVMAYVINLLLRPRETHMTYDLPLDRFNRVKNGVINNLKISNLPPKVVNDLLKQYDSLTELILNNPRLNQEEKGSKEKMVKSNATNYRYIKTQQLIENAMNNTLFVSAARVKNNRS